LRILLQRRYGLRIRIVLFSSVLAMIFIVVRLIKLRKVACNVDWGAGCCAALVVI
jgi:hypothetical protein